MSNKEQHSFSSVISVNPYKNTYVSSVSSFLGITENPEYAKDQYSISYLNTKSFINTNINRSEERRVGKEC